jgi:bifunctional non-homologous end joining protein LigD
VDWPALADVHPGEVTVRTAAQRFGDTDPWAAAMPEPQQLPADLVAEGHTIPIARVQAMHEGKRRARAKAAEQGS